MTNQQFENFIFQRFAESIRSWKNVDGIYAISFFIYDQEDDSRRPTVTLGFNTEAHIKTIPVAPDPAQWRASDALEARWNYAFWLQNEESSIGKDSSESRAARDAWVGRVPDYLEVSSEFADLCVRVARRLHKENVTFIAGQVRPVIVHELEYYDRIAQQTSAANFGGIADEFVQWVYGF